MLLVAFRNIIQEKGRLFISLAGVTFSMILMIILMGIYSGAIKQFTRFISENPTDLVIAQKGINDYFHGASLLPEESTAKVEVIPGIKDVIPMSANIAFIESNGKKYDLFVTSYISGKAQGAPWDVKGSNTIADDEIIISDTLANKLSKSNGDTISMLNQEFTIKGLVPDASSFGTNYAWITYSKAKSLATLPIVSFIYVTLERPEETAAVIGRLKQQLPEASILTKEEFKTNNKAELDEVFLPIIGAIVGIAIIVGTAVIGLTIYTATIDKIKEYGVLKAIGVSNRQLFSIVAAQSLLIVFFGFAIGALLSFALAPVLSGIIGIPPKITLPIIAFNGSVSLVMGVLASFVPLRRLLKIDPAEVFKA